MVSIMENDTKYNLKEASESLGISLNTLKKRMDQLQITTVVDGKKKLISSNDLQRLKEISRKQKTINLTNHVDDSLTDEIKNLRERLDKIELKLVDNQINSQLIDSLTRRILEQSETIESLTLGRRPALSSKQSPKEETRPVASEKPHQQDLPSESAQSNVKIKKAADEGIRAVSRDTNDSQKPMKLNAAIKAALQRMYPDGNVPNAVNGIPLEVKGDTKEKMQEILLELTGKEVTDRQRENALYKLRKTG